MMGMSDASFEAVPEEYGLTAKWEAKGLEKGREEGREEAVRRLQKYGMGPDQIAEALELPLGTVFRYLKTQS
jgi:predicted transposase YdaD